MSALFNKIDNLPIVRILQAVGLLMFLIGLIGLMITLPRFMHVSSENIIPATQTLLMGMLQVVSTPAMLLGLAQIIKLLGARA